MLVYKEGETCRTLRVIIDGTTVFNYGDEVQILRAIPAQPGHPYNGYVVYSSLTGRVVELREAELEPL